MKVIYPNNVSSVTADAENANFPDDNLNDKHPKKLWKGTGNEHTVNVVVAGGVNQGANKAPKVTCTDPDNDTDVTTGWTAGNAATLSSESGGNSGKCLKVLCDGTNNPSATSSSFAVEAGKVYRASLYHKDTDNTSDNPQWYVQDTENGNTKINSSGATITEISSALAWERTSDTFEVTTSSSGIQIVLIHQATAGDSDAYYFDDVTFYEVNYGDSFALYNTNATQVIATVRLGQDAQWDSGTAWASSAQWYAGESGTTTTYDLDPSGVGSMWGDYTKVGADHIIQLDLVCASGTVLQAGVVVGGPVNTFNDPKYGIREGLADFSIVKELNNGAIYTRKRDTVRTFSWSILDDRDPDFYTFFRTIGQRIGPDPLGWRLVHINFTDWNWVVYCRFDNMPSGVHSHITQSDIDANLIEVV